MKASHGDAYDSRCFGLVGGTAVKGDFKTSALAADCFKKDGPFYCPQCLSEAIVRKCSDKDDHFAHFALKSPTAKRGNTEFHDSIRDELHSLLTSRFPEGNWITEKDITLKSGEKIRPDICGYFGTRSKASPAVAIEVQRSPYTPRYIRKKTEGYAELNINVLWVVPLTKALPNLPFRPRRYELFLHSMYLGYVFYYTPGDKQQVTPVHYGPAFRYIEETSFYDKDGQEQNVGGFYLKYRTIREPNFSDKVALHDLIPQILKPWEHPTNNKLSVPGRKILKLNRQKWWKKDEEQEWLENNQIQYFREHFTDKYHYEDEHNYYEDNEDEEFLNWAEQ